MVIYIIVNEKQRAFMPCIFFISGSEVDMVVKVTSVFAHHACRKEDLTLSLSTNRSTADCHHQKSIKI